MPQIITENSLTYSLQVVQLNTTRHGTLTNVVSHVHWKLVAVDEWGNRVNSGGTLPFQLGEYTYTEPLSGKVVTYPSQFDTENFTEYESLTEESVLDWIKDDPGIAMVKTALKKRLELIAHQAPSQSVPWDTSTNIAVVRTL
jgi:hypothetical protein